MCRVKNLFLFALISMAPLAEVAYGGDWVTIGDDEDFVDLPLGSVLWGTLEDIVLPARTTGVRRTYGWENGCYIYYPESEAERVIPAGTDLYLKRWVGSESGPVAPDLQDIFLLEGWTLTTGTGVFATNGGFYVAVSCWSERDSIPIYTVKAALNLYGILKPAPQVVN